MNEKTKQCNCTEAGYCETFGVYMGEALYKKCQASQQWRDIFCNNYNNKSPPIIDVRFKGNE